MFSDAQLRRQDIEILKRSLLCSLGGYMVAVKTIPAMQRLFRGVRCQSRPDTISRISYPPLDKAAEIITTLGRMNRVGQSRFYCSVAAPAVFYELHAKEGDFIVLSQWEVTQDLWVHNLGYHPQALRQIGAQLANIGMRREVTHPIPNESKKNRKLRHRLSRAFTADVPAGMEYRYKQSIAINESLSKIVVPPHQPYNVNIATEVAGTVYPAIRMHGDADNVVLLPEFVDSSLRIQNVRYVKVEESDDAQSSYKFLTVGFADIFTGDYIEWQRDIGNEHSRRAYIAFENENWVMRDGYNREYDLH